jgi:hypothetical protein
MKNSSDFFSEAMACLRLSAAFEHVVFKNFLPKASHQFRREKITTKSTTAIMRDTNFKGYILSTLGF